MIAFQGSGPIDFNDDDVLIDVEGVSKKFAVDLRQSLFYAIRDMGRELTGSSVRPVLRNGEFWALNDVSFSLRRGESLGIVGPNGAGKSTLLKLITGIIKPTTGRIRTKGQVQALIELGSGMSPILTGRENIYIRASLFGIPKAEIDQKFDEIVQFAELEDYIDMPLQNYSSGMKVKLGFAIAVNVDPDVLILDEVLAVGDQQFRAKALRAMRQLLNKDIALIFVSHNLQQVQGITDSAIWLEKGKIKQVGLSRDVCENYVQSSLKQSAAIDANKIIPINRSLNLVGLNSLKVISDTGDSSSNLVEFEQNDTRKKTTLKLEFTTEEELEHEECYFALIVGSGEEYYAYRLLSDKIPKNTGETFTRIFEIDFEMFRPGVYSLILELFPKKGISTMLYGATVLNVHINSKTLSTNTQAEENDTPAIANSMGRIFLPATISVAQDG